MQVIVALLVTVPVFTLFSGRSAIGVEEPTAATSRQSDSVGRRAFERLVGEAVGDALQDGLDRMAGALEIEFEIEAKLFLGKDGIGAHCPETVQFIHVVLIEPGERKAKALVFPRDGRPAIRVIRIGGTGDVSRVAIVESIAIENGRLKHCHLQLAYDPTEGAWSPQHAQPAMDPKMSETP